MAISLKTFIDEKKVIFFIILIAAVILISPCMIRLANGNDALIGDKPYYHARIAKAISDNGALSYDKLSYQGRDYIFEPYPLILSWLGLIADIEALVKCLAFLCGIASVFLFFFILKELKIEILKRALILLVLVLSPVFIYTFSISNKHMISVPFLLLGIYLLIKRRLFISSIFLMASVFLSFFNIIILLVFLSEELLRKRNKKILAVAIVILAIFFMYYLPFYYANSLPEKAGFIKTNYLQQSISGLGAAEGFGIFSIILAIIGLSATWKNKKKLIAVYISIVILACLSILAVDANIYLNFFICFFAGIGFYDLVKRKWEIKLIMELVMLVTICGLLFSAASYINRLAKTQPDNAVKESLEWLNEYSNDDETVLSHYSKGLFIEYWAAQPVMMDSVFDYAPEINERYKDSEEIFSSRSLKNTKELLGKYNVKYIWIDNEMKTGLVWKEDKEGLLFLLRNNETFKNIYNKDNIEIWEVMEQK